ncbi:hypothetical protein PV518_36905 [Streptomyces sp. ND04-05B]|nr:hypothetical protein [Streptomyces sp. ND04-05B]MDX3067679.1 hypothetical protein [Streptomyces sp. ND04-05B]
MVTVISSSMLLFRWAQNATDATATIVPRELDAPAHADDLN